LSVEGPDPPRRGPKAGDRLPDAPIVHNGQPSTLHAVLSPPRWHLLLCGPTDTWTEEAARLGDRYRCLLGVHHLTAQQPAGPLRDPRGEALKRLGLTPGHTAMYLVRPDGHVGYRGGGDNGLDLSATSVTG